ncbi:hypothetical protein AAGS40_19655 [Paraburkholderia sp. PREW-6R]|uniref:hypothetical protein n=1 Tax=Paraburkholderia sp. PREW-6R TaxID=3141544 RepID=UPI0031F5455F
MSRLLAQLLRGTPYDFLRATLPDAVHAPDAPDAPDALDALDALDKRIRLTGTTFP